MLKLVSLPLEPDLMTWDDLCKTRTSCDLWHLALNGESHEGEAVLSSLPLTKIHMLTYPDKEPHRGTKVGESDIH